MKKDADMMASKSLSLGDSLFVDEKYASAVEAYSSALSVFETEALREDEDRVTEEPGGASLVVRFRALSHRSAALLRLGRKDDAQNDAEAALSLRIDPASLRDGELEALRSRVWTEKLAEERVGFENSAAPENRARQVSKRDENVNSGVTAVLKDSKPATLPSNLQRSQRPAMPKYQYYQSDTVMTIAILEPNVREEDLRVDFGVDTLTVKLTKQGVEFTVICGTLYDAVTVDRCKVVRKDEKVLIKLRKKDKLDWKELFGSGAPKKHTEGVAEEDANTAVGQDCGEKTREVPTAAAVPVVSPSKTRPYASHRDWDAIERNLKKQEDEESPEGEEALNKLFRDIYGKADEDTRRAMIKSFQTSGGTVLSTNWEEVSQTDYERERQAPKGMEWKDRDGNRLPQKDD